MITFRRLSPGLVLACLMVGCSSPGDAGASSSHPRTEVQEPARPAPAAKALTPSPARSAGVFVGNGAGGDSTMVNDAINLAYALAVEKRLLPLSRVTLLLSGAPEGAAARKLEEMKGEARIGEATKKRIEEALREQAGKVGDEGVLYVSFAAHGFAAGDKQYLMGDGSDYLHPESAVDAGEILSGAQSELAAGGEILMILDTCRVKLSGPQTAQGQTSLPGMKRSAGPNMKEQMEETVRRHSGTAVLYAAEPNGVAVAEREMYRGLLSGAFIDALACDQATARPEEVRLAAVVSRLQDQVNVRSHGNQTAQWVTSNGFRDLVLDYCRPPCEVVAPRPNQTMPLGSAEVILNCVRSGLFATAVIFAENTPGVFFVQAKTGLPTDDGELRLPITFGAAGNFQIHVAISADPDCFADRTSFTDKQEVCKPGRPAQWLRPVPVRVDGN